MGVPFIDLKRMEDGFLESWKAKVAELSQNTAFVGGPELAKFEENLCRDCETDFAISCANGTDALQVALRSIGVGRGDKVLLPDATFWATFESVVNAGADPVTVDINPEDLQMDFGAFQRAVESYKPKAAILVHLYGWGSAHLEEFREFCKKSSILLVEDGAQAYGVRYREGSIYKDALVSTISFYPAKVFGAAGDAGAIVTSDEGIAKKARSLCNHGRSEHYSYGYVGWNSRMDSLQAAYLNLVHPHLSNRLESRRKRAQEYRERLKGIAQCIAPPSGYTENGYLNCVLLEPQKREQVAAALKEKGIGFGIVYPEPMSTQEGARSYLAGREGGEVARRICSSVLCLPLFAYMNDSEMDEVLTAFSEALA